MFQVNAVEMVTDNLLASCSDDGSVRVWSVNQREQTLQFQVVDQVSFTIHCIAKHETIMTFWVSSLNHWGHIRKCGKATSEF